ncbi:hypothetical protein [Paraliobacillus ryukyuensis]|nr:hypothetical protein [Paraliobacillus ryukyuensis]
MTEKKTDATQIRKQLQAGISKKETNRQTTHNKIANAFTNLNKKD